MNRKVFQNRDFVERRGDSIQDFMKLAVKKGLWTKGLTQEAWLVYGFMVGDVHKVIIWGCFKLLDYFALEDRNCNN